jgi:hypothetical protein
VVSRCRLAIAMACAGFGLYFVAKWLKHEVARGRPAPCSTALWSGSRYRVRRVVVGIAGRVVLGALLAVVRTNVALRPIGARRACAKAPPAGSVGSVAGVGGPSISPAEAASPGAVDPRARDRCAGDDDSPSPSPSTCWARPGSVAIAGLVVTVRPSRARRTAAAVVRRFSALSQRSAPPHPPGARPTITPPGDPSELAWHTTMRSRLACGSTTAPCRLRSRAATTTRAARVPFRPAPIPRWRPPAGRSPPPPPAHCSSPDGAAPGRPEPHSPPLPQLDAPHTRRRVERGAEAGPLDRQPTEPVSEEPLRHPRQTHTQAQRERRHRGHRSAATPQATDQGFRVQEKCRRGTSTGFLWVPTHNNPRFPAPRGTWEATSRRQTVMSNSSRHRREYPSHRCDPRRSSPLTRSSAPWHPRPLTDHHDRDQRPG